MGDTIKHWGDCSIWAYGCPMCDCGYIRRAWADGIGDEDDRRIWAKACEFRALLARVALAGKDPMKVLRDAAPLSDSERDAIGAMLKRMDESIGGSGDVAV